MSQIPLYLDDATQALAEQAAQTNGLSKTPWVAETIRKCTAHERPQDCLALAGAFADFPLREESSATPLAIMVFTQWRTVCRGTLYCQPDFVPLDYELVSTPPSISIVF